MGHTWIRAKGIEIIQLALFEKIAIKNFPLQGEKSGTLIDMICKFVFTNLWISRPFSLQFSYVICQNKRKTNAFSLSYLNSPDNPFF